jgi:hypothetical protein
MAVTLPQTHFLRSRPANELASTAALLASSLADERLNLAVARASVL